MPARSLAVRDHGYTMKEVAEFLGRHYITREPTALAADGQTDRLARRSEEMS